MHPQWAGLRELTDRRPTGSNVYRDAERLPEYTVTASLGIFARSAC